MKTIALSLIVLFAALLNPECVLAKKQTTIGRPASKPPVYKKFDNSKKKSTFKLGNPKR